MTEAVQSYTADTRELILRTATDSFARHGFNATSLHSVARLANVTKGAVYHHFGSKEALFRAVRDAVEARTIAHAARAANQKGPVFDRIRAGIAAFFDDAVDSDAQRILFVDAPVVLTEMHNAFATRGVEELTLDLETALADGVVRPCDPRSTAELICGACHAGARLIASSTDRRAARVHVGHTMTLLLDGLLVAPPLDLR